MEQERVVDDCLQPSGMSSRAFALPTISLQYWPGQSSVLFLTLFSGCVPPPLSLGMIYFSWRETFKTIGVWGRGRDSNFF